MHEKRGSLTYYQFRIPLDPAQQLPKRKAERFKKSSSSWNTVDSRPCSQQSHNCVSIEQDIHDRNSQHILVGSALRRPHASEYSPLDYQSMPDVGKSPRQPFRPQSSCTVYNYASRPVTAREQSSHLGRHTKSSLLRCQSASSVSMSSHLSHSNFKSATNKKRLCEIRDDYRFFKSDPMHKQVPPHGESLHSFLTGARYNRARYLDWRALSKLGVYIPKPDLNSFFIKNEFDDSDARSIFSDSTEEELVVEGLKEKGEEDNGTFLTRETNTEPHYLSIKHWHSTEWKTDRKPSKEQRIQSAPLKIKAIHTYYYDYSQKSESSLTV
ncbi:unnamed protein product [Pocillopora meandrina]|uniref:Uncharacterized protein n=1 Tax=Pocillopora meandrina TaxID=46732 RepID=A0AAU9XI40_9CNID|nr:unnamed protein product [Pocillopora meandrina]